MAFDKEEGTEEQKTYHGDHKEEDEVVEPLVVPVVKYAYHDLAYCPDFIQSNNSYLLEFILAGLSKNHIASNQNAVTTSSYEDLSDD